MGTSMSREAMMDEAFAEGEEKMVLDELAAKEEVTAEDLRRLPGTEEYDDRQLMEIWKQYNAEQTKSTETPVEAWKPNIPVFGQDGKAVEDFSKLSLQDLFEGKVKLGYNANKQEQQRALSEIIRIAQFGHHNEQKYAGILAERNQINERLTQVAKENEEFKSQRQVWDSALMALTQGNVEPIKQLVQAYNQKLTQTQPQQQGMTPENYQEEMQLVLAGQQFVNNFIIPKANELATTFGAKSEEIQNVIRHFVENEGEFLTKEKLDSFIEYDIPNLLISNGYQPNGTKQTAVTQKNNEVEELKQQLLALQEQIAGKHNSTVTNLRTRKFPSPGGGNVPGAGDSMPDFKSRQDMKRFLQS